MFKKGDKVLIVGKITDSPIQTLAIKEHARDTRTPLTINYKESNNRYYSITIDGKIVSILEDNLISYKNRCVLGIRGSQNG